MSRMAFNVGLGLRRFAPFYTAPDESLALLFGRDSVGNSQREYDRVYLNVVE